jgi:hypothetical protein
MIETKFTNTIKTSSSQSLTHHIMPSEGSQAPNMPVPWNQQLNDDPKRVKFYDAITKETMTVFSRNAPYHHSKARGFPTYLITLTEIRKSGRLTDYGVNISMSRHSIRNVTSDCQSAVQEHCTIQPKLLCPDHVGKNSLLRM